MLTGLIRYRSLVPLARPLRLLSTQPATDVTVDKALLSKLRKKTGFPLLNCKKALEQFNNDIKEAEKWMRETAQREGWEKAGKLQDRPMSQGLVGLLDEGSAITIVEVNCETDFVARNEKFQALVSQLAEACHRNFSQGDVAKVLIEKEQLNSLPDEDKSLGDLVALTVGNLGENIALRRAAYVRKDPDTVMSSFVHAAGPKVVKDRCTMGKFAAVVKVEFPDVDLVAKELCQHVVGMKPTEIGDWSLPPVDKKELKKKKKAKSEDEKPKEENVAETKLMDQEFLLQSNMTVRDYMKDNGPRVVDFVRIECGENLGEED